MTHIPISVTLKFSNCSLSVGVYDPDGVPFHLYSTSDQFGVYPFIYARILPQIVGVLVGFTNLGSVPLRTYVTCANESDSAGMLIPYISLEPSILTLMGRFAINSTEQTNRHIPLPIGPNARGELGILVGMNMRVYTALTLWAQNARQTDRPMKLAVLKFLTPEQFTSRIGSPNR